MKQIQYVNPIVTEDNLVVLRGVLSRLRWDRQGGFVDYEGGGRWSFVSAGLPQVSPDELNALMALAGIEPDVIVPLGPCRTCVHSINGCERGYSKPGVSCLRPYHDLYEPMEVQHV